MCIVNIIVTQVCMFISMISFLHVFLAFEQLKVKRIIGYGIITVVVWRLFYYLGYVSNLYILAYSPVMCFFIFKGRILKKIILHFISIAIYCFFNIGSYIAMRGVARYFGLELPIYVILIEVISTLFILMVVVGLKKSRLFTSYKRKEQESIAILEFCCINVLLEANFIIFVSEHMIEWENGTLNRKVFISFLLGAGIFCVIYLGVSIEQRTSMKYYKEINCLVQRQLNRQLGYYKWIEEAMKETMAIKHDMNNHLIVIKSFAQDGKEGAIISYVDRILKRSSNMNTVIKTGNSIVDAIVNEKIIAAKENNIEMELYISLGRLKGIESIDLCVIIANSIDNAIAACIKITNKEKRKIKVIGRCDHGYFSYYVINPVVEPIKIKDNYIVTEKSDKINHGYGLKNMMKSIEKYKGKMEIECTGLHFYLDIHIPIKDEL